MTQGLYKECYQLRGRKKKAEQERRNPGSLYRRNEEILDDFSRRNEETNLLILGSSYLYI